MHLSPDGRMLFIKQRIAALCFCLNAEFDGCFFGKAFGDSWLPLRPAVAACSGSFLKFLFSRPPLSPGARFGSSAKLPELCVQMPCLPLFQRSGLLSEDVPVDMPDLARLLRFAPVMIVRPGNLSHCRALEASAGLRTPRERQTERLCLRRHIAG
jgi:hypothetical protein